MSRPVIHWRADQKNPCAVALGRKGGLAAAGKGIRATNAAMTAAEKSSRGRKAAAARWAKKKRPASS